MSPHPQEVEKAFDALAVFDTRRIMNFMTMMSSEVLVGRSDLAYGTRVARLTGLCSHGKWPLLDVFSKWDFVAKSLKSKVGCYFETYWFSE